MQSHLEPLQSLPFTRVIQTVSVRDEQHFQRLQRAGKKRSTRIRLYASFGVVTEIQRPVALQRRTTRLVAEENRTEREDFNFFPVRFASEVLHVFSEEIFGIEHVERVADAFVGYHRLENFRAVLDFTHELARTEREVESGLKKFLNFFRRIFRCLSLLRAKLRRIPFRFRKRSSCSRSVASRRAEKKIPAAFP